MINDPINPDHYKVAGLECIDVIEKLKLPFHLANALKYIWRAGRKNSAIEDIKKARWYLDRYISAHTTVPNVESIESTIKPEYTLVYDYRGQAQALYFVQKTDAQNALDKLNNRDAIPSDFFYALRYFDKAWAVVEIE